MVSPLVDKRCSGNWCVRFTAPRYQHLHLSSLVAILIGVAFVQSSPCLFFFSSRASFEPYLKHLPSVFTSSCSS
ncbi:hypothetical protein BDA96_03G440600 [Sorghum bicolor]|uniref:Uncharacterized protein n=1 Tax=Sorghum bicolor TaxID=4558 RepID=A0A921RJJ1_SORBI|nr:hypothetical protein BDA96_03G440600 [Sorghum bicolor]